MSSSRRNLEAARILFAAAAVCSCLGGRAATDPNSGSPDPDVVFMQQFVVEATRPDWKILQFPGFEVLSRASASHTRWFASSLAHALQLQDEIVPAVCLSAIRVPYTSILFQRAPTSPASVAVSQPLFVEGQTTFNYGEGPVTMTAVGGISRAMDVDTMGFNANLWHFRRFDEPMLIVDGGVLAFRLNHRHPGLPLWLSSGLADPFGLSQVLPMRNDWVEHPAPWVSPDEETEGLAASRLRAETAAQEAVKRAPADVVPLAPFVVEKAGRILLLPLSEIFRERPGDEAPPSKLWRVEAALFVRWAYLANNGDPAHAGQFHKLVERATREPVTEAVFEACFGFGYGKMEEILAAYQKTAVLEPIHVRYRHFPVWPAPLPPFKLRPATDAEVARIIGDWERMKGVELRAGKSPLAQSYLQAAGETLTKAYRNGIRDPDFLAVLGLYEHDVGDDAPARQHLEAAVKDHAVRPGAYLILAGMRFREAAADAGPGKDFNARQMLAILQPIFAAREQDTLNLFGYVLMAEAFFRSPEKPTVGNLAALSEGLQLYPRSTRLAVEAAPVSARWGYTAQKEDFIQSGLKFADDRMRTRLLALRTGSAVPQSGGP